MAKIRQYPNIRSHTELSTFPVDTQRMISSLGAGLYDKRGLSVQLAAFRAVLQSVPPYAYRSAASDIRDLAKLWFHYLQDRRPHSQSQNFEYNFENERDLPYLLLFDWNGYNRERALAKISGPLKSPTEVLALADLANNWVEPVRIAALKAIDRAYPATDPIHLASSFSFFAENRGFWKRWHSEASEHVMEYFHRPDVISILVKRLEDGTEPRGPTTLSFVLQTKNSDPYLERLLKTPKKAALRARVLRAILSGKVVWKTGVEWKWTDKSLGEKKKVPVLRTRKLSVQPLIEPILLEALNDKSAHIRRIAAQSVIDRCTTLNLPLDDIVRKLMADPFPGVRRRGEYLARKMGLD